MPWGKSCSIHGAQAAAEYGGRSAGSNGHHQRGPVHNGGGGKVAQIGAINDIHRHIGRTGKGGDPPVIGFHARCAIYEGGVRKVGRLQRTAQNGQGGKAGKVLTGGLDRVFIGHQP
ncbi:hypothetical protein JCM17843_03440 [Kordiimonadales bacterium JCM 17843]|nr:hypothetical protein JCM17843_03440 [Kordiimonadales bacterium JCM 17843]